MTKASPFGARLRYCRKVRGWTLKEMEQSVGIPAQTLSRYELQQHDPKVSVVVQLADKLNVDGVWLMGFDTNRTELKTLRKDFLPHSWILESLIKNEAATMQSHGLDTDEITEVVVFTLTKLLSELKEGD